MKSPDPHLKSQSIRHFKPTRKPAGLFGASVVFLDAALLVLAFFLLDSPFVLQPGINIQLPASPFTGGAHPDALILSITRAGSFYFNDERLPLDRLPNALQIATQNHPSATLVIEADTSVPHGTIVQAWNAALSAGISKISIATQIAATQEPRP
jgi:biopolymer transport protein ExbD